MRVLITTLAAVSVLGIALHAGCSSGGEGTPNETSGHGHYVDTAPAAALDLIDKTPELVILDVSPFYEKGHIGGALNYPIGDGTLEEAIPNLDKNMPYLVYCHTDISSIAAAEMLLEAGFDPVYRLEGNFAAWVGGGYEMQTGPEPGPRPTLVLDEWRADGAIHSHEYAANASYEDYHLYWRNDSEYMYTGIAAKTDGWVAVGFRPSSRMKDADIVLGYVEEGTATVLDMISLGEFGPHPEDVDEGGTDDILEYAGSEAEGFTVIEFKRALVTGDEYDEELAPGTVEIIWSYGSSDNPTDRHTNRGHGEIELR